MSRSAPLPFYPAFASLAGAVAFSLSGMLALRLAPAVAGRVGPILPQLMAVPTWIYSIALPVAVFLAFYRATGWRRGLALAGWGAAVGASAELLGTTTGLPFGPYAYSDFLGPKILGHVPWVIPPSWYAAAMLSFSFASRGGRRGLARIALAAAFMVLWDVALDPAMSAVFPVWLWQVEGPYYGMPLINWCGWFVTAVVIMGGFEVIGRGVAFDARPWPARLWLVNGAFAIGICAGAGLWPAVMIGSVALVVPLWLANRPPTGRRLAVAASDAVQVTP